MAQGPLSTDFNDNAPPPPVLEPEAYRILLEKLMGEGRGFGKTEAVAGYLLHDVSFLNETEDGNKEQRIKVEPLYMVMDLKEWPNAYGRSLAMQEIGSQYAKRMVGEEDMNCHDFSAPGIWTAKKKAFESDYLRRPGVDEKGKPVHLYDPNPDAYRVCLTLHTMVTIPTPWGKPWTIRPEGALAIRESHVGELAEALQDIRNGKTTAEAALFTTNDEGKTVAKFDVYGMMPGFLSDNYKPVPLKAQTVELMKPFEGPKPPTMPVLRLKNSAP